jgi:CRISPR system Cascade subunit CasC
MYLDINLLQDVPPSNINRDDTGSPKTAVYGGYQRARVSSQAWKHAMRENFSHFVDAESLGYRTKHAVGLIGESIKLQRRDLSDSAERLAMGVLSTTGVKVGESKRAGSDKGSQVSQYLIFIGKREIDKLARIAIDAQEAGEDLSKPSKDLKKKVSAAFHGQQALDIALFGRMLADAPDLNTDASAQVAHAISVNKVTQEYDYFTAVDDCVSSDNAGAAMLDTLAYNSSTLYRYATVNVASLREQLGDDAATAEGVRAFVRAFVESMPTGKQNTFANRTLPSAVLVALREEQPINGVGAFESPVMPKEGESISSQAEGLLARQLNGMADMYGQRPAKSWWCAIDGGDEALEEFGQQVDCPQLYDAVKEAVLGSLSEGEEA